MLDPSDWEYMQQLYTRGHLQAPPKNYDILHYLGYVWEDDDDLFAITCTGEDIMEIQYPELEKYDEEDDLEGDEEVPEVQAPEHELDEIIWKIKPEGEQELTKYPLRNNLIQF